jgi:hypothetical protein
MSLTPLAPLLRRDKRAKAEALWETAKAEITPRNAQDVGKRRSGWLLRRKADAGEIRPAFAEAASAASRASTRQHRREGNYFSVISRMSLLPMMSRISRRLTAMSRC